jgi:hypothetical protein
MAPCLPFQKESKVNSNFNGGTGKIKRGRSFSFYLPGATGTEAVLPVAPRGKGGDYSKDYK